MKTAINSKGETVVLNDNQNVVRYLATSVKIKELSEFSAELCSMLAEKGINADNKCFVYMTQPFYSTERLVYFTKTEFSSSSQAVKLSQEIEKHPEILAYKDRVEFLKSIFEDTSDKAHRWFFVNVGYIAFERNFYDCKKINIKAVSPVPYAHFMANLSEQLVTQDDMDCKDLCPRFELNRNGVDLQDIQQLLNGSFIRDIKDGQSMFDQKVNDCIKQHMQVKGYAYKDRTSNRATSTLSIINESNENIFSIYEKVKNCIKKNFKGAYGIKYKGNCIVAQLNDTQSVTIYVSGTQENPQFITGGQTFYSLDELKENLLNENAFKETKWFSEKVKPNIEDRFSVKHEKIKVKDELTWLKKPRKTRSDKGKKRKSQSEERN